MKSPKFLSTLLCYLVLLPIASQADEWQKTTSRVANFSIQLPGESQYQSKEIDTDVGKLKMNTFYVEVDNGSSSYLVICTEYPEEIFEQKSTDKFLDDAAKGATREGKVQSQIPIIYDGCSGRELVFTKGTDPTYYVKWRMVLHNKILYQIGCVSAAEKVDDAKVDRMFNSFEILSK